MKKDQDFQSDNGGEYTCSEFTTYSTSQERSKHELQHLIYTPQQNGAAERLDHALIEGVRTILAALKLPHRS